MSISLNIEVDEDEIIRSASRSEKQTLLRELLGSMDRDDIDSVLRGQKNEQIRSAYVLFITPGYNQTIMEQEHNNALLNLSRRYMVMSKEDCDAIINISKKY